MPSSRAAQATPASAREGQSDPVRSELVVDLSPTEYLIVETLMARYRLGERTWNFPKRYRKHIDRLVGKGIAKEIREELGNIWIAFTPEGRRLLSSEYRSPLEKEAERSKADLTALRRIFWREGES